MLRKRDPAKQGLVPRLKPKYAPIFQDLPMLSLLQYIISIQLLHLCIIYSQHHIPSDEQRNYGKNWKCCHLTSLTGEMVVKTKKQLI